MIGGKIDRKLSIVVGYLSFFSFCLSPFLCRFLLIYKNSKKNFIYLYSFFFAVNVVVIKNKLSLYLHINTFQTKLDLI